MNEGRCSKADWDFFLVRSFLAIRRCDAGALRATLQEASDYFERNSHRWWSMLSASTRMSCFVAASCTKTCLTLMHFALAYDPHKQQDGLVQTLVHWGAEADVDYPLCFTAEEANEICPWKVTNRYSKLLVLLCEGCQRPIPVCWAVQAAKMTDEFREYCLQPGRVRWTPWCVAGLRSNLSYLLLSDSPGANCGYGLVGKEGFSDEELFCKRLVVQSAVCNAHGGTGPDDLTNDSYAPKEFLNEGASANGWSASTLLAVGKVCKQIGDRNLRMEGGKYAAYNVEKHFLFDLSIYQSQLSPSRGRLRDLYWIVCEQCCTLSPVDGCVGQPLQDLVYRMTVNGSSTSSPKRPASIVSMFSLLPVILQYWQVAGEDSDPVASYLLSVAQTPWLSSLRQIPYADGKLHDGPSCDHQDLTTEQRQVSLAKCFRTAAVLETLQCLSRDVILSILFHNDDVIAAARRLPLPEQLKTFLLYG